MASNFAYPYSDEPIDRLRTCGIVMPVQFSIAGWEANKYVTFGCGGADVELVGEFAAQFVTRLLTAEDSADAFTVTEELL